MVPPPQCTTSGRFEAASRLDGQGLFPFGKIKSVEVVMADVCLTLYPIELGGLEMVWEETMEEIMKEERTKEKDTWLAMAGKRPSGVGGSGKSETDKRFGGAEQQQEAESTVTSYHSRS